MNKRIIGFDLTRAYAILGMFLVNFNTVFGSFTDNTNLGRFLSLFSGNSSSTFVVLAGMGISLMTNNTEYSDFEKENLKKIISKRSWFLFTIGLLLYIWWPADILHYYSGYMHISLIILFKPKNYYLWAAFLAIIIFHILFVIIPYQTGWNFSKLEYTDFWTVKGFLRNSIYNGWNAIFPWIAYFFAGMWLGKQDWRELKTQKKVFLTGLILLISITILQKYANYYITNPDVLLYISADYIPPFLPFMLSTFGFALILLASFMYLGNKLQNSKIALIFAKTGQMTLTHYISHLTLGMILFALLTGKKYTGHFIDSTPVKPIFILVFGIGYFIISCLFSWYWSKKFKNGPIETIMRKISG